MDSETQKIFQEQLVKLPKEVITFLSSSAWNEDLASIASMYNLEAEQSSVLKREASLVLIGLTRPVDFTVVFGQESGLRGAVLEAVVKAVEEKVFAPVRPALVEFLEKEANLNIPPVPADDDTEFAPEITIQTPSKATPQNLPIAPETDWTIRPFVAPVKPVVATPTPQVATEIAPHPFEEKMKQVFTAGTPSPAGLILEPIPQITTMTAETPYVTANPVPSFIEPSAVVPQTFETAQNPSEPLIVPLIQKTTPEEPFIFSARDIKPEPAIVQPTFTPPQIIENIPVVAVSAPQTPAIPRKDPYREPIE